MRGKPNGATHRFGEIACDARTGELSTPSGTTRLTPQLVTVLDALIERPGELITREVLHSRRWPAGTFVDFEHGLSALVSRLREALGDSPHEPGIRCVLTRPSSDSPPACVTVGPPGARTLAGITRHSRSLTI